MKAAVSTEEQIPERLDPDVHRGQLVEAQHLARYRFASRFAPGRRVLDAGTGTGYGARLLADAGAAEVVGVDVAAAVVESEREQVGPDVDLRVGDLTSLDFGDGRFDLVVCFEVIEHVDDREGALAELVRVLAPRGLLLVSSPNRDVYVPGNPHHVHEYLPEELRAALGGHLDHVELWRQHDLIGSAVLDDGSLAAAVADPIHGARITKTVALQPGRETFTVAVAGNGELPPAAPEIVTTDTVELRHWVELWDEQRATLDRQHQRLADLSARDRELDMLREQLLLAETQLCELPKLEFELEQAQHQIEYAERRAEEARAESSQLREELDLVVGSASWRVTAPLRQLRRRAVR